MSNTVICQGAEDPNRPTRRIRSGLPEKKVSMDEEDLDNPAAHDALWSLIYEGAALIMLYIKKPAGISNIGYIRIAEERLKTAGAGNLVHHLIIHPIRTS